MDSQTDQTHPGPEPSNDPARPEIDSRMIDRIDLEGRELILVGTAHVSRDSAELVTRVIESHRPDTVCVELCATRLKSIRDAENWKNMDIVKVIREKKALLLLMNLLLASFQKRIAGKFDIRPGQEMINAVTAAEKAGIPVEPIDREIQTTLSRVWRTMGFWAKVKLLFQLAFSLGGADEITEEDVERMKQEDILKTLLSDVKKSHPVIEKILIDERDQFLAQKLRQTRGSRIVAVVGAGHAPGIRRYLASGEPVSLADLNRVPPGGSLGTVLKWLIPAAILVLFAAGFFMKGKGAGTEMIWAWILANGVFAGLGALAALAHPWTILTAMVAAPITSLNPMIAAGWVSGLVEALSRKPKVRDLESLPDDILSVRGFWRNNVTRILLVVVFTNLGSTIGTVTAIPWMLRIMH
jgi:pheromone shutdown-related protein TraB